MARYALEFAKTGYMIYTSHLDMMRLFKRAFKRAGLPLSYSQGFNPHPRMSFAQPLSLGYEAEHEYLEFHFDEETDCGSAAEALRRSVPEGLEIISVIKLPDEGKTMASAVEAALYEIVFPVKENDSEAFREALEDYLAKDEIVTLKREKKSKQFKPVDIKPMIRSLTVSGAASGGIAVEALIDQGSASNLSPDLIVDSLVPVLAEYGIAIDRYEVAIKRRYLVFSSCFPQIEGPHFD